MKILLDHPNPFLLAHGGFKTQIEETKGALERSGVNVEYLRWWDGNQKGDLIHFFGIPPLSYIRQARSKGMPVILTHLLTSQCNRSDWRLRLQGGVVRLLQGIPGGRTLGNRFGWESLQEAARVIVGLACEKKVLETVFGICSERISLLPLGLHPAYLQTSSQSSHKGNHLITTGTITERKRSVELAQMALSSRTPILFVGKPYSEKDPYWQRFQSLIDNKIVLYRSHIDSPQEMAELLRSARGFVLFSVHENWCLSAHEAAACGLPICVPDQNWSRERFGNGASYLLPFVSTENPARLRRFYSMSERLTPPVIGNLEWTSMAERLSSIYKEVLISSSKTLF